MVRTPWSRRRSRVCTLFRIRLAAASRASGPGRRDVLLSISPVDAQDVPLPRSRSVQQSPSQRIASWATGQRLGQRFRRCGPPLPLSAQHARSGSRSGPRGAARKDSILPQGRNTLRRGLKIRIPVDSTHTLARATLQTTNQARRRLKRSTLKGALIPIVALTRGFPLAPFGWSGTRRLFP
jgi:hypothetical protein